MQQTDLADPQPKPDEPATPDEAPPAEPTALPEELTTPSEESTAPSEESTAPSEEPTASSGDESDRAVLEDSADSTGKPPGRVRRLVRSPRFQTGLTVLACVIVFAALLYPNVLKRLNPGGFARIPIEAGLGIALLILVPRRVRVVLASIGGIVLGLLIIEKSLDMGWFETLARPFDPILDWELLGDAYGFARDVYGPGWAYAAIAGIALLVLLVPALTTWAVLRVAALLGRFRKISAYTAGGVTAVWLVALLLGLQIVPKVPVAARSTVTYAWDRVTQAKAGIANEAKFAEEVKVDPFKDTPGDKLLTALRGKDVIFTFVESYGRNALEAPELAPGVNAVLAQGTTKLQQSGFAGRSGWLTSPTFGGNSWLAHSTLLSGLWINNQGRYRNLTASDRLTIPYSFKRAGWDTVSVMPGATRAWPEGTFYGYNRVWDSRNLGYQGPKFSWAPMPDQYTLKQFTELEYKKPGRQPLMVEMPLVSSHTPWAPIPEFIEWDAVGDGSVYADIAKNQKTKAETWAFSRRVKKAYGDSIEYTLTTLIDWVKNYADDNLVLVFLGDHQPSKAVSGENASHDVPITIVTKDGALLERMNAWNWSEGLKPATDAPVWPMNTFRDQFLTTFGSQSTPH
ncbi:sulfatase-like hydrolase/transferase [Actinoplanes sp. GCM10030250]|uniref:sulfatase-like hydrolase/transferase n=1 Tax=Actinoplanes sp. GCM10030250 TaxID=3273376 RepID=UPI00361B7B46